MPRSSSTVRRRRPAAADAAPDVAAELARKLGIPQHRDGVRFLLRMMARGFREEGTQYTSGMVQSIIDLELDASFHNDEGSEPGLAALASSPEARDAASQGAPMILAALEEKYGDAVILRDQAVVAPASQGVRPSRMGRFLMGVFYMVIIMVAYFHIGEEVVNDARREVFSVVLDGIARKDVVGAAVQAWTVAREVCASHLPAYLDLLALLCLELALMVLCCSSCAHVFCCAGAVYSTARDSRGQRLRPSLVGTLCRLCCRAALCCCLEDLLAPVLMCCCFDGRVPSEACCCQETLADGAAGSPSARVGGAK